MKVLDNQGREKVIGLSGYSGFAGTIGIDGESGFSGTSGVSGFSSQSGVSGISGISGHSGVSGVSGYSGTSGWSGAGTSGHSGISGLSGTSGISGDSGISGFSGKSGVSGFSGISGTSGISGIGNSGYSGISGFSGVTVVLSCVQATHSANQACSTSYADINFDTDQVNVGGSLSHDPTGVTILNDKVLINSTGQFFIAYGLVTDSSDNNSGLRARVRINDSTVIPQSDVYAPVTTTGENSIHAAFAVNLTAGDFVTLQAMKESAGENWLANQTSFLIYRLQGVQGQSGQSGYSGAPGPSLVYKSANQTRTNTTVLADDSELKFSMLANTKYQFEFQLFYATANATCDIVVTLNGPAGVDQLQAFLDVRNATGGVQGSAYINAYGQTASNDAGGATDSIILITGTLSNGSTAGDLAVQWAQRVSDAGATTVKKGSYLRAHRI